MQNLTGFISDTISAKFILKAIDANRGTTLFTPDIYHNNRKQTIL